MRRSNYPRREPKVALVNRAAIGGVVRERARARKGQVIGVNRRKGRRD